MGSSRLPLLLLTLAGSINGNPDSGLSSSVNNLVKQGLDRTKESLLKSLKAINLPDLDQTKQSFFEPLKGGNIPDAHRDAPELITSKGYALQEFKVTTKDGFILTMLRIPGGKTKSSSSSKSKEVSNSSDDHHINGDKGKKKIPVLLLHGLLDSCATWVLNLEHESLGFILADRGYDVWLGNSRGNTYSMEHRQYSPDDNEFWDFTFDDMAKYDLPAMVDQVLNTTGLPQLSYVAHSQGTTQMFIALTTLGEDFQRKIAYFNAFGPVIYATHASSPVFRLLVDLGVPRVIELLGMKKFGMNTWLIKFFAQTICSRFPTACEAVIFLCAGQDSVSHMNATRVPVVIYNTPAGTSVKNMLHWTQAMQTKGWQMFDYGSEEENKKHYGPGLDYYPPRYDIGKLLGGRGSSAGNSAASGATDSDSSSDGNSKAVNIDSHTPIPAFNPATQLGIISGTKDTLADPADVLGLLNGLKNRFDYSVEIDDYEHLDYMWATNAHEIFYEDVIKAIERSYPTEILRGDHHVDHNADEHAGGPGSPLSTIFKSEIRNVEGEIEQVVFT